MRSEAHANEALHSAALERQRIIQVLATSKTVQRQRYQKVAKKQQTLATVSWFSVMLAASALIGALLAY